MRKESKVSLMSILPKKCDVRKKINAAIVENLAQTFGAPRRLVDAYFTSHAPMKTIP